MKKRVNVFLYVILAIVLCYGYWHFEGTIHKRLSIAKQYLKREKERREMHKVLVNMDMIPSLIDEPGAWYTKYHVIAHSGGGINGKCYTNSKEAWDYHYAHGTRIFDADLSYTSDSVLVLRHGWNDNLEQTSESIKASKYIKDRNGSLGYEMSKPDLMDFQTFIKENIYFFYSPQSVHDMIHFMKIHPDVYMATDIKNANLTKGYLDIVKCANDSDATDVLDRIIASVYTDNDLSDVQRSYPFRQIVIRQYINHPHNYSELAALCIRNNIHVVNVSACYAEDEGIKWLHSKGIHTYIAVVDFLSDMSEYRKLGFEGCVSNYIDEDDYCQSSPLNNERPN
jgi:glycerophosphoryl diester phosphodiesterase